MTKRRISLVLAAALAAVAFPLCAQQAANADGRYLIKFKDFKGAAQAVRAHGGNPVLELAEQRAIAAYLPAQAIEGLRHNPNVELVEEDPQRWPMGQVTPYGITMVQADQVSDANAGNTTICIIDSGYYIGHEDLAGNHVSGVNNGGTGNWYEDSCGHGTHVAGTISALYNSTGVVGVLPGGKVNLQSQKVFDGASCQWSYASTLVAALNNCRNNTAPGQHLVVSMSLGGNVASVTEDNAFQSAYNAGVLSVAAAGNAGNTRKSYPASYASVISVAAVDANKVVASFSQQNNAVELAAPGVGVLSTVPFAASTVTAGGVAATGENMDGSARANANGTLVDGGLCSTGTAGTWTGKVVLCERGTSSFATKVASVKTGGGVAAVIFNNVSGGFSGTLNGTSTIPAITISQEDGNLLKAVFGFQATVNNAGGVGSGYAYYDGTSMATPHVAGVAALVWSNVPAKTNVQLRAALQSTAEDLGAVGRDNAYGYGLIRAKNALVALGGGSPPPNQPPVASFTTSCTNLDCSFTDTSTDDGTIASRNWDFGDGATSSATNPSHSYAAAGSYTVNLVVTDNGGLSNPAAQTFNVSEAPPNQPPLASFTTSCTYLACSFTDTSTDDGTIVSRSWTFGDGGTSTATNPSHTYGAASTYDVTLIVTDNNGVASNMASQPVTVTAPPPPPSIVLNASGTKVKGVNTVSLNWTGTNGSTDVYRNGAKIVTATTATTYSETLGKGTATYTYKVCNAGSSTCSSDKVLTF